MNNKFKIAIYRTFPLLLLILSFALAAGVMIYKKSCENRLAESVLGEYVVSEKMVAITFDDGPHSFYTEKLLDGLKERGVQATFFVLGSRAQENPKLIKRMSEEGHLIGNHTYSHSRLNTLSTQEAIEDIERANCIIEEITGQRPKYIRPPYGELSEEVELGCNLTKVLWSVDPDDWATTNCCEVVNRVVNNVQDGDIILLHDIYASSVAAALEIIDILSDQGYIFVTLEDITLD